MIESRGSDTSWACVFIANNKSTRILSIYLKTPWCILNIFFLFLPFRCYWISVQKYRKLLKPPNVLHHFSHNIYNPVYYVKKDVGLLFFRNTKYPMIHNGNFIEIRTFCLYAYGIYSSYSENLKRFPNQLLANCQTGNSSSRLYKLPFHLTGSCHDSHRAYSVR